MDALLRGVGGILIGAAVYSEVYPYISGSLLKLGLLGKLTLPSLLGVNHWLVIIPLAAVMLGGMLWLDRRGPRPGPRRLESELGARRPREVRI